MRFWLLALGVSLLGAQAASRQIEVLAPTSSGIQPATTGTWGKQPVSVLSLETAARTSVVILADLAATPIERHACLLQEISAALPELSDTPIYASTSSMRANFYSVEMADGLQLGLLSGTAILADQCKQSLRHPEHPPMIQTTVATHDLLRALAHRYAPNGPLRIIWISTDFRFYDWRKLAFRGVLPTAIAFGPYPTLVEFLAESLSEGPVTLFPLLVRIPGQERVTAGARTDAATALADRTGGIAAASTSTPGEALKTLLAESRNYQLIKLDAPTEIPSKRSDPARLHLGRLDRVLVTDPPAPAPILESSGVLLTSYRNDFAISGSCIEQNESGPKIRLHLPEQIAQNSSDKLLVHIEALRENERSLRQRVILKRPGPLCVTLQEADPGTRYLVVLRDEAARWTAIRIIHLKDVKPND